MAEHHTDTQHGFGRALVAVYAVFTVAATARSVYQLVTKADEAPVAYALSALAGIVYGIATWALATGNRRVARYTDVPLLRALRTAPDHADEIRGLLPGRVTDLGHGYRVRVLVDGELFAECPVTRVRPQWSDTHKLILDRYVHFHEIVEFEANPRSTGRSSWSWFKLWRFALDGLFSFSTVPLKVWTYVGGLSALGAFIYLAITLIQKLVYGIDAPGYASLLIVMLFFNGLLLLSNGVQGEYIARIFEEVKGRPLFVVAKKWGFDDGAVHVAPGTHPSESSLIVDLPGKALGFVEISFDPPELRQ